MHGANTLVTTLLPSTPSTLSWHTNPLSRIGDTMGMPGDTGQFGVDYFFANFLILSVVDRDNIYGGKLQRIERQIHHYGSGLNALPLITEFQSSPNDFYLLRVGYAGLSGPLSNIDPGGFASASFHSFADTLKWDGYSGDYGPNFSGHTMGMGTFIIKHPDFGWQAFGGKVTSTSPTVQVQIRDSIRRRVFIAPIGSLLTLDAGAFSSVVFNPQTNSVEVSILATPENTSGAAAAPRAKLLVQQKAAISGFSGLKPPSGMATEAGAVIVPFTDGQAKITLV